MAEAACAGWSLPSWGLFHPRNPPLCLHLLHSASGAGWKLLEAGLCLCPLLCQASSDQHGVQGPAWSGTLPREGAAGCQGSKEVSWELLLPFLGENWLGCPGPRAGTGWDSVLRLTPLSSLSQPLVMLVLALEPPQPPGLLFWCISELGGFFSAVRRQSWAGMA